MTAVAISLGTLNPKSWREVALIADEAGIESVFVSDHVVAPVRFVGRLGGTDERHRMQPGTPLADSIGYLHYLAGITERVRLGTYVYLLGLRHPFTAARGFASLDQVSGGRALAGVGAGWLESEWDAVGISPRDRGARLDEAIGVCRRLWTEDIVEHHGPHFAFEAVGFDPKPLQPGGVPVHVGGESRAARRRAAIRGDGWMGLGHDPATAAERARELRALRAESALADLPFSITVGGALRDREDARAWEAAGVDRVMVTPWTSSRTAATELRDYADTVLRRLPGRT